tara:strand:- start:216 stop:551 length:336 start_codon:yes stop_codon:yes gene_type:complete
MKVKDLIKELKKCDQNLKVLVHFNDDIHELHSIDTSIKDRVDINLVENEDQISVEWCTEDVISQCDWLTKEQAREVLQMCKHKHDCTIGINWEVIDEIACEMFPIHSTKQV